MIALALSGLVLLFFFLVSGITLTKVFKIRASAVEKILLGLAVTNTVASTLSLFVAVNSTALIILLFCLFPLLYFIKGDLRLLFFLFRNKNAVIISALPFIICFLIISLGPPLLYDTGLYHLQTIKWIEEYPVVPGLANLHSRFGFNSNLFSLYALTSLANIFGQEIFAVNFIIFSTLVFYFIQMLSNICKKSGISNLFIFNLLMLFSVLNLPRDFASPTPDFITTLLTIFIFSRIINDDNKDLPVLKKYIPLFILSVYGITVKLSMIPIIFLFIILFIRYRQDLKATFRILPVIVIIILPWITRYIILTGWLIYPFPSVDIFNFDWEVPLANVINEKLSVIGFSRSPDEHWKEAAEMSLFQWFPIWWDRLMLMNKLKILASLVFPIMILTGWLAKKIKSDFMTIAAIITSFAGVIFWFINAPDLRFGRTFILFASISPLVIMNFRIPTLNPIHIYKGVLFLLISYFFIYNIRKIQSVFESGFKDRIVKSQVIEIPAEVKFQTINIKGGYIFVPSDGDRCFNSSIPCTPFQDTSLVMRGINPGRGYRKSTGP